MTTTLKLTGIDVTVALEWKSLRCRESIGQPDELTADVSDFRVGDPLSTGLANLLAYPESVLAAVVERDGDIRFSGVAKVRRGVKKARGAITWTLSGTGWEYLAAKRLVGAPDGSFFIIQGEDDPDRLPTAVAVDSDGLGEPTPASVQLIWSIYWAFPVIDTDTYVTDVLPVGATVPDAIGWSGSDLAGATNDLAAMGSAAAMWWLANDAPLEGSVLAPHLALHWGLVAIPDDGDTGDDLLAGFPSADPPTNLAPFDIDNDNPDWIASDDAATAFSGESVMPMELSLDIDLNDKDDAVYVRGATGFTEEIIAGNATPYQVGAVIEGGTGWVGVPRQSVWGESYIDAPGAINPRQRDAFGNAWLGAHGLARWTGTIKVSGFHGWHKGQLLKVTDSDYRLDHHWMLIRGVESEQKTPDGEAAEYTLTVGDSLRPDLGFALRQQRLAEQRKPIEPATQFVPYVGDLLLAPGESAPITMQLANAAGKAMAVKGVNATWGLMVNGVDVNPADTGGMFYLAGMMTTTDEAGQITATLNASASATAADAASPWARIA